ncbi:MAG: translocation/assembly module TamB domain-containing protein [Prevotellaceae bacterium]|nr:translocation/assembly module TamB domain-containing protein [Prevotellaceae bacterium]
MKWIKYIFNICFWTVVSLYLLIAVMVHIPYVQQSLASGVASVISSKLNTRVEIGRVDLGFLNRLVIDNTTIYDQGGKPMVRAARLAVRIDLLQLVEGRIRISSAQVFSTHFTLYRANAASAPNFQFALDALASKDSTKAKTPLDLSVNSFIMRHCSVKYDQLDRPHTPGRFNPAHLHITNIGTYIRLNALTDDSLNVALNTLSATEQSGVKVDAMSLSLVAGGSECRLRDLSLRLPHSHIAIADITARYRRLADGKVDMGSLRYSALVKSASITPSDLSPVVPQLADYRNPLQLRLSASGTAKRVNVNRLQITSPSGELSASADGWYEASKPHASWSVNIHDLHSSLKILQPLSYVRLRGSASCTTSGVITTAAVVNTDAGSADVNMTLSANRHFSGTLAASDIALGTLLNDSRLGDVSASLSLSGSLPKGKRPTVTAEGEVSKFAYNGYTYSNININGSYADNTVKGSLIIDDPNISLVAQGEYADLGKGKQLVVEAQLDHFRPSVTRLTDKWGDAVFSSSITADLQASGVNDSKGVVTIGHFRMQSSSDTCTINNLQVRGGFDSHEHYLVMESDFGYAMLTGHFNYSSLVSSVTSQIGRHIPVIAPKNKDYEGDNNFTLIAHLNSTKWMRPLLGVPLDIRRPLLLRTNVSDASKSMVVECEAPLFIYDGATFSHANVNLHSHADSLICSAEVKKHQDNGDILDLSTRCNAADNLVDMSLGWLNEGKSRGCLNATSSFGKNSQGVTYAHVVVKPSDLTIGDKTWLVKSSDIHYTPKHIDIREFTIAHDRQHIIVNGTASASKSDSLHIDLNGIDVRYVLDLVNFHAVDFDGSASGKALIVAPFGDMSAHADLTVRDFLFERGRMGVLSANVNWNKQESQIDIDAIANDGDDARTIIKGYVSPKRDYIDLGIQADSTHIDFMHSFTESFISEIDGRAVGKVRLAGPLSTINLTGQLVVNGSAMISPLNCRYTLDNDTVTFVPDEIELKNAVIRDAYGNAGYVNGFIHHKHLTRLSYDLEVAADNLLAYDFRDFGNDTFYGTVFADGTVGIHGRSGYLRMDIDVTPRHGSTFVYNASTNDQISNQEFIKWNDVTSLIPNFSPSLNNSSSSLIPNSSSLIPNSSSLIPNSSSDMFINFNINCTPEATIRLLMDSRTNDYITMQGNGMLRATYYNKGAFNLFGTYTLAHGTYGITIQNIIKKNFTFREGGTFVFGGNPYDATLNLQAIHTVNGVSLADLNVGNSFTNNTIKVNCLMNIGGIARNPQVSFDLDMPTVSSDEKQMIRSVLNSEDELNQQVVYLLGIGRFYPTGTNNSASREQSETSLAMQSLLSGTISSQISSVLNTVIKNDNWNFGANISTGDEGWNNAEYEGTVNGRLLNNRLLINGQFGYRDNVNTANTNFIGDFDIRYLLMPNGNLALKVYNQTNDRYFTKSSLNTQGVGIIMKKDFRSIIDLFGKKKKKDKK